MGARYSSFLLLGVVVTSLSAVWGAPTGRFDTCGQRYYYYDHGTDSCENCRDICDNANVTRTVEQCWDQCRAYALILWPPRGPPGETPAPGSASSDLSKGTSDTISSGAAIVIVALIVACMLVLLLAVFFKRKAIVSKFLMRRANRAELVAVGTDPPAAQPTGQQGRTNPYVPLPQDLSVAASPGSEPSSAAATAGTQEQGATGPSEGNHSWRILPADQPTPSPGKGCIQPELRSPVQVSMEGNSGAAIMALPGGQPLRPALAELVPAMPNDDPDDFNSTELKTLLPSVDDSLTPGAHGGPATTRV